jgi:hypothetical protein
MAEMAMRRESPLLLFLLLAFARPGAACADMLFYVKNGSGSAVAVEVFSQDRDQVWPGGDQVWLFEPGQKKTVPISCSGGEHICYGAWVNGNDRIWWGVGPDGDRDCKGCCLICLSHGMQEIPLPPGE